MSRRAGTAGRSGSNRRHRSVHIPGPMALVWITVARSFSRRDYVFIYTGPILAATVKGRYKRVWIGEHPGLTGAAFFDLFTDPREVSGKMLPMFPAKGMFNMMKARHQLWIEKYPHTPEERGWPLTGIANARPETEAAGRPRVDLSKLPFDPMDGLAKLRGWEGVEFDRTE